MNTINKLFRTGELNRWLYWKIDSLFIEDYPRIDKLQKNFKYWTVLFVTTYIFITVWIHDAIYGCGKNESIALWWVLSILFVPSAVYFGLWYFRRVRFMHYYVSLRHALSIDCFGFDYFLQELDRDFNHAIFDSDGYVYNKLSLQLRNGLLSVEAKFGDRAQETPEWLYYRDRFSQSFHTLKRFHLIAKPDKGWTPYMSLAKKPFIQESTPS